MRLVLSLSLLGIGAAASLSAQVPQMNTVQPESGKIGSVLQIHGVFLGKTKVDEVYLTDHTFDMKVKVLGQTDDIIEFRIPPSVKPGRLQLLVKTTGHEPLLLEQPVFITVEEPKETLEASAAAPATSPAPAPSPGPATATK
jgi:hypothetical protein